MHDLHQLPEELVAPEDDGAAAHLLGSTFASVTLPATNGRAVDLSLVQGWVVVFAYPRTGRPGKAPLVSDWNDIPGARGCTPQTCGYRDLAAEFAKLGAQVFGLSTQSPEYQAEMVERLHVPFAHLSDEEHALGDAMSLPHFSVAGQRLLKRLALIAKDGVIKQVFYPVFPPDRCAAQTLDWLRANATTPKEGY